MQVPACGRDVGVAHESLDDVDILASAHEARGIAVTPPVSKVSTVYAPPRSRPLPRGCAVPEGRNDSGGSGCPWGWRTGMGTWEDSAAALPGTRGARPPAGGERG
jgi:hypothetical protein